MMAVVRGGRSGLLFRSMVPRGFALHNSDAAQCAVAEPEPCYIVPLGQSRWARAELHTSIDWLNSDALTTLLAADVRVRHIEARVDTELDSDGRTLDSFSSGAVNETQTQH